MFIDEGKAFLRVAVIAGVIACIVQIFPTGDLHGYMTAAHQPATVIRQAEMAEAYQQGKGSEGVCYEDLRGAMTSRGKLPPGLHFEDMLAEQRPRLETLRALEREIDLLDQSYGLKKKNNSLTTSKASAS